MTDGPTFVADLTPPGRGAVAVVVIDGPDAVRITDSLFVPVGGQPLGKAAARRVLLGHWGAADGEEVTAVRYSDFEVELHCHGGLAAVRAALDRLIAAGCRRISWQDWTRSRGPDPIRASAAVALAAATTARSAAILLDQQQGALAAALREALALAESDRWSLAEAALDTLLSRQGIGLHLTTPWRVVLAGPPNVGKSSLLNALAGFQRAIISPEAGTTRDVLTFDTAIDGWPVQLADTAGLRRPGDALEAAGVELTKSAVSQADLVLDVCDVSADLDRRADGPTQVRKAIVVINKSDLLTPAAKLRVTEAMHSNRAAVLTSARTGDGIEALVAAIARALAPSPVLPGMAVPFTQEQVSAISTARAACQAQDQAGVGQALQALLAS